MKVLIVDDDTEKLRRIVNVFSAVPGAEVVHIDECRDSTSAKRYLRQNSYDLLVLDIAIPERIDSEIARDGGLTLLAEVCRRDQYKRPHHVCIITAYPDLEDGVRERFPLERWRVLTFDATSDAWADQLRAQVIHIAAARTADEGSPLDYGCDLAIICALDDVELESVLRLPWNWEIVALPRDGTIYRKGHFLESGKVITVVAAAASRMGMTWASVLSVKMISAFRPRYLIMSGICAGVPGRAAIGDVIVAETSWDYGSGKYEVRGEKRIFAISPHQLPLDMGLVSRVRLISRDHAGLAAIRARWPGPKPRQELQVKLGPIASGAAVIADSSRVGEIEEQNRKVVAIDMEAYAVFAAAADCAEPRPTALVVKGVSDLADEEKSDSFQPYAAYVSAEIVNVIARTCVS
jgi:nucleoside phosphorylase/CheY-like chemotaxis protein